MMQENKNQKVETGKKEGVLSHSDQTIYITKNGEGGTQGFKDLDA